MRFKLVKTGRVASKDGWAEEALAPEAPAKTIEKPPLPEPISPCVLVKEHASREGQPAPETIRHWSNWSSVTGNEAPHLIPGFSNGVALKLWQHNMMYIVPISFVCRFRYAATVRWHRIFGPANPLGWQGVWRRPPVCRLRMPDPVSEPIEDMPVFLSNTNVQYRGDIPDSVLEKAEKAISIGIKDLTIHSQYPLPVEYQAVNVDPILIGWEETPQIGVFDDGGTMVNESYWGPAKIHGVVLAIWGPDGEIDLG